VSDIKLKGISKFFDNNEVIKSLDLSIANGEFITVVGPSGCGKSTLLRIIAGLESQSSGDVIIDGREVNKVRASERDLAMVFQSYALYPHLSVQQNLMVPLKLRRLSSLERLPLLNWFLPKRRSKMIGLNEKVLQAAETLQITHLMERKPGQLSGGQQQRVAVGRAMVREPVAFLMDEPLSNLDAALRVHMRAEISELHRKLKTTFIYVTHDQAEALTMSDRMAVMMDGEVLQHDTPSEIYNNPVNLKVAEFIGSPKINVLPAESDSKGKITCMGLPISMSLQTQKQGNIMLGFRPEHTELISSDSKTCFEGKITYKENLGSDIYLHVNLKDGQHKMIVRSEPEKAIDAKIDDIVKIGWMADKVMAFEENGQSLPTESKS
jgi:multiple sugar transport system ATP-binding protein|tara:strand:+ start:1594 stop:2733 length:1140 start_codon:yes stop_codon:yes gene_type:complete